jgi:ArsR family transcriptional regulator
VLLQADEAVCVCEFQPTLDISQPTVSHHLKQLVEAGILEREKRGTFAYYRLKPGVLEKIGGLLAEPSLAVAV